MEKNVTPTKQVKSNSLWFHKITQQQIQQANAINTEQIMWQNLPETSENKQNPQQNQEQTRRDSFHMQKPHNTLFNNTQQYAVFSPK